MKLLLVVLLIIGEAASAQVFPDSYTDGKFFTVNGAKLYTVSVGEGQPLIIIPGGPGGTHLPYRSFDSLSVSTGRMKALTDYALNMLSPTHSEISLVFPGNLSLLSGIIHNTFRKI